MGNSKSSDADAKRRVEILKIQKKTNLHKVDVNVLNRVFTEVSGGKVLNREKFNEALGQLERHGLNKIKNTAIADSLFQQFDRDHNGTLDLQEFLSGMTLMCKGSIDDKISLTFKLYDTDNSGYIDKKEMAVMMTKSLESAFAMAASVNRVDKDQEMDLKEMMNGISDMVVNMAVDAAFKQCDKNGDGKLTLDEFKTWAISDAAMTATINGMSVKVPITLFAGIGDDNKQAPQPASNAFNKEQVLQVGKELAEQYRSKDWQTKLSKIKKEEDLQPTLDKIAKAAYEKVGIPWKDKKAFEAYSARWANDPQMQQYIQSITDVLQPVMFRILEESLGKVPARS